MYTLGIDLHKKDSEWVLIDDQYQDVWSRQKVQSHPKEFNKHLKELPAPPKGMLVAIEPVGAWRPLTDILTEAGMEVHIANPRKVRLIAESTQKTDHNDAHTLAQLLQSGYFPEARKVPEEVYQLRLLLRERQHVVRMRVSTINRLHGIATTQGLHKIAYGNPITKVGKASIMEGTNTVLQELHLLIEELDRRIAVFDDTCTQTAKTMPQVQLLMTIPSVGVITALTVLGEVGDFNDFKHPKKLAAFAGLVPKQRSSGSIIRFGSITHQGSPMLRTTLVECAMRIHQKGAPELHVFVERLKQNGTGAKKARVALARKLLCIMWSMIVNGQPYNKSKVFPPSVGNTTMSKLDTEAGT